MKKLPRYFREDMVFVGFFTPKMQCFFEKRNNLLGGACPEPHKKTGAGFAVFAKGHKTGEPHK